MRIHEKEIAFLERLKKGDLKAFDWFFECYSHKIFKVARKFGLSAEDSEEIVQDVFLKLWQRREGIRLDQSIVPYLKTISKHLIIRRLKDHAAQFAVRHYLKENSSKICFDTEEQINYNELLTKTHQQLQKLPAQQREIFEMNKLQKLPPKEIAEKLNLSSRTVENHLYRAVQQLRKTLKESGIHLLMF